MPHEPARRFDEPKKVRVLHDDGRWYTGFCEGWSKQPDGTWWASCWYTVAIGAKHVRSLPAHRVELAE